MKAGGRRGWQGSPEEREQVVGVIGAAGRFRRLGGARHDAGRRKGEGAASGGHHVPPLPPIRPALLPRKSANGPASTETILAQPSSSRRTPTGPRHARQSESTTAHGRTHSSRNVDGLRPRMGPARAQGTSPTSALSLPAGDRHLLDPRRVGFPPGGASPLARRAPLRPVGAPGPLFRLLPFWVCSGGGGAGQWRHGSDSWCGCRDEDARARGQR